MKRSKWDQRIQRADELTSAHPFAAEALRFYKGIATFQKELYAHVDAARGNGSRKKAAGLFDEDLNLPLLLPKFPEFLSRVSAFSPRPIAESAGSLRTQSAARVEELLAFHWRKASDSQPAPSETEALLLGYFYNHMRNVSPIAATTGPVTIVLRSALFAEENH